MKYLIIVAMFISCIAFGQQYSDAVPQSAISTNYSKQVFATIVSVAPIYENVVIGKQCEPIQRSGNVGGALVGASVGAGVGSRFGKGRGSTIMAVLGAIFGASVGNQVQEDNGSRINNEGKIISVSPTVQCTPVTQLKATAVSYVAEYDGQKFSGVTYRPIGLGDRVAVNVISSILPAE